MLAVVLVVDGSSTINIIVFRAVGIFVFHARNGYLSVDNQSSLN